MDYDTKDAPKKSEYFSQGDAKLRRLRKEIDEMLLDIYDLLGKFHERLEFLEREL